MRKLHFPKFFSKLFTKNRIIWIAVFVLSFAFFLGNMPSIKVTAQNTDTAGYIYLSHFDSSTGEQEGFVVNLIRASAIDTTVGQATVTNVTTTGSAIIEYKGGLTTAMSDAGDYLYANPSGSAIVWAQDQIQQVTSGKQFVAFAYNPNDTDLYQVSGYTALSNTIGLWNWSRNIVYAIFIIILIVVAFMILFRRSLGGQQYITLANSLPSIILSLVLITFSYPISAVFIDAVSIGSNLAYNMIIAAPNAPGRAFIDDQIYVQSVGDAQVPITVMNSQNTPVVSHMAGLVPTGYTKIQNIFQPDDPQMSLWSIFATSDAQVCGKVSIFGTGILQVTKDQQTNCQFSQFVAPAALAKTYTGAINTLLKFVNMFNMGNILVEVGLIVLILTAEFKIFMRLIKDYLILSFFPILSPWLFLVAALPNRTGKVLGDFVRILGWSALNMIIIYACFLLLIVLGYSSGVSNTVSTVTGTGTNAKITDTSAVFQLGDSFKQASQLKWVPPMLGYSYGQIVGNSGDPGMTSGNALITTVIIIAFFMMIPRIPEELQAWLQVPQLPAVMRNTASDIGQGAKRAGGYIAGGAGAIKNIKLGGDNQ